MAKYNVSKKKKYTCIIVLENVNICLELKLYCSNYYTTIILFKILINVKINRIRL